MSDGFVSIPESAWGWSADNLPEGAVGIRLVRMVGDGLRLYEGIRWEDTAAVAQFLRQQLINPEALGEGSYGVIDFLDADYNIVGDIGVDDSEVFQRLRRKLNCRVEYEDVKENLKLAAAQRSQG